MIQNSYWLRIGWLCLSMVCCVMQAGCFSPAPPQYTYDYRVQDALATLPERERLEEARQIFAESSTKIVRYMNNAPGFSEAEVHPYGIRVRVRETYGVDTTVTERGWRTISWPNLERMVVRPVSFGGSRVRVSPPGITLSNSREASDFIDQIHAARAAHAVIAELE